jgi:hypothetical protein
MAKTNIKFNDKIYSIDEATLSAASTELKSHLSTVMNGDGAVITFGGDEYSVDSTKLTSATNDFIAHLGTITGNGMKVVVGGVEYGVDSAKVAGAFADLEAVLSDLHSEGNNNNPQKNEYGFYYNVPYEVEFDEVDKMAVVFLEDNRICYFSTNYTDTDPTTYYFEDSVAFTYDEASRTITDEYGASYVFSEDGESLEGLTTDFSYTFVASKRILHGIYYGYEYVSSSGDKMMFLEDGTEDKVAVLTHNDISEERSDIQWTCDNYGGYFDGTYVFTVSIDGETIWTNGLYEKNVEIIYHRSKTDK